MQLFPWMEAIHDRLTDNLPNTSIFFEGVPENTELPRLSNGMVRPFASLWFGQSGPGPFGTRSMTGVRQASRRAVFLVQIVAPTGRALLQLEDGIRDLLVGFRPNDEGELSESSPPTIRDPLPEGTTVDLRFYKPLAFSGLVNSTIDCSV